MGLYVDYNATTPLAEGVLEEMLPYFSDSFGNASSTFHRRGKEAAAALDQARERLAQLIDAEPEQIVFTSGGTESCVQAFLGVLRAQVHLPAIAISAVEHPAVQECAALVKAFHPLEVGTISVDSVGKLDMESFESFLRSYPGALVSLMAGNNETGILFPIKELAAQAQENGAIFHCDATQIVGKQPLSFKKLGVDLLSLSAHKFGGPKGIGALVLRDTAKWQTVMPGGGQERGRRGGTEAVALIAGMGAAAKQRTTRLSQGLEDSLKKTRDTFEQILRELIPEVEFHGETEARLPNTSSVYIPGVQALAVRDRLAEKEIVLSTGSACHSTHTTGSKVLRALGRTPLECLSVFRISFGPEHNETHAREMAEALAECAIADRSQRAAELAKLRGN